MENKVKNSKKEMPEHIKKMFEQMHNKSDEKFDDLSVPQDESKAMDETVQAETVQDENVLDNKTMAPNSQVVDDKKADGEKDKKSQESNKKKHKLSKKTLIILISCISAVCIVALVLGLVFGLSPRYTKMSAPTVEVHALSDRTIVSVNKNENANIYEFEISFGTSQNTIRSNNPSVTITSYLTVPGEYVIRARYIGDNARENSDYSEAYSYANYKTLTSPSVTLQNGVLAWEKVDNAQSYHIYYGSDENAPLYLLATQSIDTPNVTFDLSVLSSQKAGRYYLYVQAIASPNSYYTNSDLSKVAIYDNVKQLATPQDVNYDRQTNTIIMNLTETIAEYDIEIVINKTYTYIYNLQGESTRLSIDLSPYILAQDITSIDVRALGDDEYLLSSQTVNVALA